jgi:hypothetical protein
MLMDLRNQGHAVGLCGNWGMVTSCVQGWQHLISFFACGLPKHIFLTELRKYAPAEDWIMVGNIGHTFDAPRFGLQPTGGSDDMSAAADAVPPWRFISEQAFANGTR